MKVRHDEDVASHIGPESCAGLREGVGEALTGEHTGQPSSRERKYFRLPTRSQTWKATRRSASSEAPRRSGVVEDPWHVWTLFARETGDLQFDHLQPLWGGPCREGEEPKPMMNEPERSDPSAVATKLTNGAGLSASKPVERKGGGQGEHEQCPQRTGHRAGEACFRNLIVCESEQGKRRRNGSPLYCTT